jgi:hypothetical protein
MKRRWQIWMLAVAVLSYPSYWLATQGAIRYCAHDLTSSSGCTYVLFNSGDESRFLMRMGSRSVGALERQIDDPGVSLKAKIHLAWILSSIGNHSRFGVFVSGLNAASEQTRYIAAFRMRDFPAECLRNVSDILQAGMKPQHDDFWTMLSSLVGHTSLNHDSQKALLKKLVRRDFAVPLTSNAVAELLGTFEGSTTGEPVH